MSRTYPNVALVPWELIIRYQKQEIDESQFTRMVVRSALDNATMGLPPDVRPVLDGVKAILPASEKPVPTTPTAAPLPAPTPPAQRSYAEDLTNVPPEVVDWVRQFIADEFPSSMQATDDQIATLWLATGKRVDVLEAAFASSLEYQTRSGVPILKAAGFTIAKLRNRQPDELLLEYEAIQRRAERNGQSIFAKVSKAADSLVARTRDELDLHYRQKQAEASAST